jgi:hypothetical protein
MSSGSTFAALITPVPLAARSGRSQIIDGRGVRVSWIAQFDLVTVKAVHSQIRGRFSITRAGDDALDKNYQTSTFRILPSAVILHKLKRAELGGKARAKAGIARMFWFL